LFDLRAQNCNLRYFSSHVFSMHLGLLDIFLSALLWPPCWLLLHIFGPFCCWLLLGPLASWHWQRGCCGILFIAICSLLVFFIYWCCSWWKQFTVTHWEWAARIFSRSLTASDIMLMLGFWTLETPITWHFR
jgi:hypothetical protein